MFEAGSLAVTDVYGDNLNWMRRSARTDDGREWERDSLRELEEALREHGAEPKGLDGSYHLPRGDSSGAGGLVGVNLPGSKYLPDELWIQMNSNSRIPLELAVQRMRASLERHFQSFGMQPTLVTDPIKIRSVDRGKNPSAQTKPNAKEEQIAARPVEAPKRGNWVARLWREHSATFIVAVVSTVVGGLLLALILSLL